MAGVIINKTSKRNNLSVFFEKIWKGQFLGQKDTQGPSGGLVLRVRSLVNSITNWSAGNKGKVAKLLKLEEGPDDSMEETFMEASVGLHIIKQLKLTNSQRQKYLMSLSH